MILGLSIRTQWLLLGCPLRYTFHLPCGVGFLISVFALCRQKGATTDKERSVSQDQKASNSNYTLK